MKKTILFGLIILLAACTRQQLPNEQLLSQGWVLSGDTLDINIPVEVPSVVQQNLYDAGLIPHPYYGTVEEDLLWISDHPWTYSTRFNVDQGLLDNDVVELVFEGIDTYASVTLNGQQLFEADNQFRTWKQDVKPILKANDNLLVVDFPRYDSTQLALYEAHQPKLPEKYAVTRKAPYQHGWDWAPKYKNVGLWKPVKLVAWSDAKLENAYVVTHAADDKMASLTLHLDLNSTVAQEACVELKANGRTLHGFLFPLEQGDHHKMFDFEIPHPELWWPNEMGTQPLYDFEVNLVIGKKRLDTRTIRTGIKTVELCQRGQLCPRGDDRDLDQRRKDGETAPDGQRRPLQYAARLGRRYLSLGRLLQYL